MTPLAIARRDRPGCKLIEVIDQRTRGNLGKTFVLAAAPGSAWFDLLPEHQVVHITDAGPREPEPPITLPTHVNTYQPKGRG